MLNASKCLSQRPRGRGQSFEVKAEAEAKFKETEHNILIEYLT